MFDDLTPNKREIGDQHEAFAAKVISEAGFKLVERNYLCKLGEIDIIAKNQKQLVFIEVRYRKSELFGGALQSINLKKRRRICLAANHYLQTHKLTNKVACRFDVFAITGNLKQLSYQWIEAAFEAV